MVEIDFNLPPLPPPLPLIITNPALRKLMTRTSGRFGFSRVVWDHEIAGSDDEHDSTPQVVTSSISRDAAMEVDSCPPFLLKLNSQPPAHSSPTPLVSELKPETVSKGKEITSGIKLCRIWIDPLDVGQVCYQGDNRFRILKTNWRREAELRRLAACATRSGNVTTQPVQVAGHPLVISSPHTSHSLNKPKPTATKKGTHKPGTDLLRQWKLNGAFRIKKKRENTQTKTWIDSEFPAAIPTILNGSEALACPMEGCGNHFTRKCDYFRHMQTVHRPVDWANTSVRSRGEDPYCIWPGFLIMN